MSPTRRRLLKWSLGALGALTIVTAIVHVPRVQQIMGWVDHAGKPQCPFGHEATAATVANLTPSNEPALGFRLGATTELELGAWTTERGIACTKLPRTTTLECLEVPTAALGLQATEPTTVWFDFTGTTLRAIRTIRHTRDGAVATLDLDQLEQQVSSRVGAPIDARGERLDGLLAQVSREYRRDNYRAVLRATNLGDRFAVTESYSLMR